MARPIRKPFSKERPVYIATKDVAFPHVAYATWQLQVLKPWLERNRKGDI